jgi:hypothetical protein
MVCCVISLVACQKEVSKDDTPQITPGTLSSSVMPDDPERVANITLLRSADFNVIGTTVSSDGRFDGGGTRGGSKKDSDGDGISNANDACPNEKETVNGYQDNDGCPDTVPTADTAPPTDTTPVAPPPADTTPVIVLPPTTIPTTFELATPPVGNQGNEGICVPFAIAYAARSIEYYYNNNASAYSTTTNIFSPEYAYNLTKFSDCGSGTSMTAVLDLLQQQGVCTWQMMPYNDLNGCSLMPDNSQTQDASNYKISSYVKIVNTDQVAIKTMVASKHPVIVTILADNSFVNAKTGFVWRAYSGAGVLPHTLIICGYDDSKNAYKVMNSWGTTWGDAGYSWIDYNFLPEKSSYYLYAIQ